MWSLGGDDAGDFTIEQRSSNRYDEYDSRFAAELNYSNPANNNNDNVYNVVIQVSDRKDANGNTDTAVDDTYNTTVTVTNVDEPGTASFSGTLSGGSTLTANGDRPGRDDQRRDVPVAAGEHVIRELLGHHHQWDLRDVCAGGRGRGEIPEGQGVLHGRARLGQDGNQRARGPVGASNSEPTFSAMTATRTLPENSSTGTNVGNRSDGLGQRQRHADLRAEDRTTSGSFTIVSTSGQIQAKTGITYNFEGSKNSYTVIVTVHDGKDAAGGTDTSTIDDEIEVTINLTNVNEAPTIAGSTTRSIPENSTAVATYTATDPDASTTYTWSVESADDGGKFDITSSGGVLTFRSAPDFETPTDVGMNNTYVVTVKVTDNGSPKSDTHTITVTVTNVNEAPEITTGPTTTQPSTSMRTRPPRLSSPHTKRRTWTRTA